MQNNKLVLTALLTSLILLGGFAALSLWLLSRGSHLVQMVLTICILGFLTALFLGVFSLGLILVLAKPLPLLERIAGWAVGFLFPLAQKLCAICGISKEALAQSFIAVNNRLVRLKNKQCQSERLLLLLPHCLQWNSCPHKLDSAAKGCLRCGGCQLGELLAIKEEYGIQLALATGGTLARKVINTLKPKCVVAVACERDLVSGIMETKPLAVYGVLNQRPHGPCFNTRVDLDQIREAIELFLQREVG